TGDPLLLGGILDEQEDFKALARLLPRDIARSPASLALVLHQAGDSKGCEAQLRRIPASEAWARPPVLFFIGRPKQAIELEKRNYLPAACELLALQGRRREALALSVEKQKTPSDLHQQGLLFLEQAMIHDRMGNKEEARKLVTRAIQLVPTITDFNLRDG